MRSGPSNRRSRGRGNGSRRGGQSRNQSFESNGPDVRVRGSVQQVVDKYQALAREASTAGDPIKAEGYFQHAEHYLRVMAAQTAQSNNSNSGQQEIKTVEDEVASRNKNMVSDEVSVGEIANTDNEEISDVSTESEDGTVVVDPVKHEDLDQEAQKRQTTKGRRTKKSENDAQEGKSSTPVTQKPAENPARETIDRSKVEDHEIAADTPEQKGAA